MNEPGHARRAPSWILTGLVAALLSTQAGRAEADCTTTAPCLSAPINVGTIGSSGSTALGISADGSVVVGVATLANPRHAYRWKDGVMTDLGALAGATWAKAYAVNWNGAVIVGSSEATSGFQAVRWTLSGGIERLGTLGGYSEAYGLSADGSVVAGFSNLANNTVYHAFRWTAATGMTDLGTLGGTNSNANGVSGDGRVLVGISQLSGDTVERAFRWTEPTGMIDLGSLGGSQSSGLATNSDGSVIVGRSYNGSEQNRAFRWTQATGMVDLGTLGGAASVARAVSANGAVVVGNADSAGNQSRAFRWTQGSGLRDLNTLLANAGVTMTGIDLKNATAVSANGQFIAGEGDFAGATRGFVVRYDDGIGGVSVRPAQQAAVDALAAQRGGVMAQQHGLAAPLLGAGQVMGRGSEAGMFAAAGSASAGGTVRYANGRGLSLLGGLAWASEDYPQADMKSALTAAAALQYIFSASGATQPFIEAGGFVVPGAALQFTRDYMNGAGMARGQGETRGTLTYVYTRAGLLWAPESRWQFALSGELGHETLRVDDYVEQAAGNPFQATVSGGADHMSMAKVKGQVTRVLTSGLDAALWAAQAWGFSRGSTMTANVVGFGSFTPQLADLTWTEYGLRVGYRWSKTVTVDIFANGVAGSAGIASRLHAGAGLRFRL